MQTYVTLRHTYGDITTKTIDCLSKHLREICKTIYVVVISKSLKCDFNSSRVEYYQVSWYSNDKNKELQRFGDGLKVVLEYPCCVFIDK